MRHLLWLILRLLAGLTTVPGRRGTRAALAENLLLKRQFMVIQTYYNGLRVHHGLDGERPAEKGGCPGLDAARIAGRNEEPVLSSPSRVSAIDVDSRGNIRYPSAMADLPTDSERSSDTEAHRRAWFTTTHWSVVVTAKDGSKPLAAQALEKLCQTYWPPLYTFIRREGYSPADAQDLTQEFFGKLLAQDYLAHLKHQNGRFRSFLLTFVKHFLSDQRAKAKAQKRGGGRCLISLDDTRIEERRWLEPKDEQDPEKLFEKLWAHKVLEEAVSRLAEDYQAEGKAELFGRMKEFQPGVRGERGYAEVAAELDMSETAFKSAIHRMRQRYSRKLRDVVANTVAAPAEIDQEIQYLLSVLSN